MTPATTRFSSPPPDETPLWPGVEIRALFPLSTDLDAVRALLERSCGSAHAFATGSLDDDEWRAAARRGIPARMFGQRLWLAPADDANVPAGLVGVKLHMGLAFGTGEHPTTALCLEWLDAALEPGATVLDYGCGSGVLAIAALALGANRAWAIDNDEQALIATRDNARLNGCEARIAVSAPESLPELRVDVVLANILAAPLVSLAPELARVVVAGRSDRVERNTLAAGADGRGRVRAVVRANCDARARRLDTDRRSAPERVIEIRNG